MLNFHRTSSPIQRHYDQRIVSWSRYWDYLEIGKMLKRKFFGLRTYFYNLLLIKLDVARHGYYWKNQRDNQIKLLEFSLEKVFGFWGQNPVYQGPFYLISSVDK